MTKLKKWKWDKTRKTENVTKLKNWNCDQTQIVRKKNSVMYTRTVLTHSVLWRRKNRFIKYNWRQSRVEIFALKIKLYCSGKKTWLNVLQFFMIKYIYFFFFKDNMLKLFSIFRLNVSSYGHSSVPQHEIWVPTIANLGCFGPKPYLLTPIAHKFLDQNDLWKEKSK